jgi:hypothetical protein
MPPPGRNVSGGRIRNFFVSRNNLVFVPVPVVCTPDVYGNKKIALDEGFAMHEIEDQLRGSIRIPIEGAQLSS